MSTAIVACPRCGYPLATTDGKRLFIGSARVERVITLHCAACDAQLQWRPDGKQLDIPAPICKPESQDT